MDEHSEKGKTHRRRVPAEPKPNGGLPDGYQQGREGWKALLDRWQNGMIVPNLNNACIALEQDPAWRGLFRRNDFNGQIELDASSPLGRVLNWKDEHSRELARALQKHGIHIGVRCAHEAAGLVSGHRPHHPVRDYLAGLKWDGVPRLQRWLRVICNAADNEYTSEAGACWLRSAVARILYPGCKVDHMLIFDGKQGIRKSTVFEILASPGWFLDGMRDFHSTDTIMRCDGHWIIEVDELGAFRASTIERIKSFITQKTDVYRRPYAVCVETHPRQFVLAGTTNKGQYLTDTTGNRRFWPIHVEEPFALDELRNCRDQLWAEAVEDVQKGAKWYFDKPEIIEQVEKEQVERLQEDAFREAVLEYEYAHRAEPISILELLKSIQLQSNLIPRDAANQVSEILKERGREKIHSDKGNAWSRKE